MNLINSAWLRHQLHSASLRLELNFKAGRRKLGSKVGLSLKNVWVIGAWDLDIVCFLLFGAWNLLNSRSPFYLDTRFNFFNIFVAATLAACYVIINCDISSSEKPPQAAVISYRLFVIG